MKNTFGQSVSVTLFGESHGEAVGAVLDGLSAGVPVDEEYIKLKLSLRRPSDGLSTARREPDDFQIVSGAYRGFTTGTPLCILIPNTRQNSEDYDENAFIPRPGHADLTGFYKYNGFEDRRGGGHFSGRLTAALVAAGAVAQTALKRKGVKIGTHIARIADVKDRPFGDLKRDLETLETLLFAALDEEVASQMKARILEEKARLDSVGGVLETAVTGLPKGVGEPFFDTLEGVLSHALFAVPAVKGVEFGAGFGFASMTGREANDGMRMENGEVTFLSNHNGGVLGGISTGAPLLFRVCVKPTPSIGSLQQSVDLRAGINAELTVKGRHDPCIVHRARAVTDAVTALTLCDLLALRFGTDFLGGERA